MNGIKGNFVNFRIDGDRFGRVYRGPFIDNHRQAPKSGPRKSRPVSMSPVTAYAKAVSRVAEIAASVPVCARLRPLGGTIIRTPMTMAAALPQSVKRPPKRRENKMSGRKQQQRHGNSNPLAVFVLSLGGSRFARRQPNLRKSDFDPIRLRSRQRLFRPTCTIRAEDRRPEFFPPTGCRQWSAPRQPSQSRRTDRFPAPETNSDSPRPRKALRPAVIGCGGRQSFQHFPETTGKGQIRPFGVRGRMKQNHPPASNDFSRDEGGVTSSSSAKTRSEDRGPAAREPEPRS